jgi:hypothetical protein
MCLRQVSRLSKCTPRYLTSSACGRYVPLSWTGGHVDLLSVNVIWVDFSSFAFKRHFASHCCIPVRAVCSLFTAIPGSSWVASTAVTSANVAVIASGGVGRSAVYIRNSSGPRTLPCGTPEETGYYALLSNSAPIEKKS